MREAISNERRGGSSFEMYDEELERCQALKYKDCVLLASFHAARRCNRRAAAPLAVDSV